VHPTWVDREDDWIVRPVLEELAQPDLPPADRARLEQSLGRTAAVVGAFIPAP